jgi:hypothetical protein
MLRLVDVSTIETDSITFTSEEVTIEDLMVYVVYDTSTGVYTMEDYYGWRVPTAKTSTGATEVYYEINNSALYPSYSTTISDYTALRPALFRSMSYIEYTILQNVLIRIDLVRRRMPNPGYSLSSTNSVGQNGAVAYSGGFEKKLTVGEIMQMVEGAIVELNATPPLTSFWPAFLNSAADKKNNPYIANHGLPYDMMDVTVLGTVIRCLMALGLLEVDISFSTSDSGLQLTFDRVSHIKGWREALLQEYKDQKSLLKMNHANHSGVGVGTVPWASYGIWGTLMNNVQVGGQLALNSVLGFNATGNVPM